MFHSTIENIYFKSFQVHQLNCLNLNMIDPNYIVLVLILLLFLFCLTTEIPTCSQKN